MSYLRFGPAVLPAQHHLATACQTETAARQLLPPPRWPHPAQWGVAAAWWLVPVV